MNKQRPDLTTPGRTIAEIYDYAMEIETREEAEAYVLAVVTYCLKFPDEGEPLSAKELHKNILSNIGYYAGYFDEETRQRVYALYDTESPIFGRNTPTPEEAFEAGYEAGERARRARQE